MDIASNLTHLIAHQQLRREVNNMQLLSTHFLIGHKELRLAHMALSFITMGYVWQDGEHNSMKVLPKSLAVPYCEVSKIVGLPPILVHADCVLANWKKKDGNRSMELRNLDTILALPGGDSLKGFFLVTLEVELAAVQGIKAVSIATEAVLQHDDDSIKNALQDMAESIRKMNQSLKMMDEHVDPATFYGIIRLFLSGTLPKTYLFDVRQRSSTNLTLPHSTAPPLPSHQDPQHSPGQSRPLSIPRGPIISKGRHKRRGSTPPPVRQRSLRPSEEESVRRSGSQIWHEAYGLQGCSDTHPPL
uniref:indoleamine 2,3-dioxygenase 1 isoform X5 n=1 Tax=Pristiophorus japonicus TaxID=55135 RepID=UPI00398F3AD2